MSRWSFNICLLPVAALGPALLWASPFGYAQDWAARWHVLVDGYPRFLIPAILWLLPGIVLSRWRKWEAWYVVPSVAVTLALALSVVRYWPPSQWWPLIVTGQPETPSGFFMGYAYQAWGGYFSWLWTKSLEALVAAMMFVAASRLLRPTDRWSAAVNDKVPRHGAFVRRAQLRR
jgi:hypothetical protein